MAVSKITPFYKDITDQVQSVQSRATEIKACVFGDLVFVLCRATAADNVPILEGLPEAKYSANAIDSVAYIANNSTQVNAGMALSAKKVQIWYFKK